MNKYTIFIVMILTLLMGCNQVEFEKSEISIDKGDVDMNLSDDVIKDALILENALIKTHKEKYAGYWIDDNEDLLVLHTGLPRNDILESKKLVKSRKVIFKKVRFSLMKLQSIKKIVQEKVIHMTDNGIKISSININVSSNRVMIGLYGKIETDKEKFLTYFDKGYHKYFQFIYKEPAISNQ